MALVCDEYWLKLADRERRREKQESRELWRVGKSEEVGLKALKKLITKKRECSARVERSRADDCGGVVCVRRKDFRFIGGEFHKRGEELRNDQSANLRMVETGKDTDNLRNEFCWEV